MKRRDKDTLIVWLGCNSLLPFFLQSKIVNDKHSEKSAYNSFSKFTHLSSILDKLYINNFNQLLNMDILTILLGTFVTQDELQVSDVDRMGMFLAQWLVLLGEESLALQTVTTYRAYKASVMPSLAQGFKKPVSSFNGEFTAVAHRTKEGIVIRFTVGITIF